MSKFEYQVIISTKRMLLHWEFRYAVYAYFEERPLISSIKTKIFGRQNPKILKLEKHSINQIIRKR